MANRKLTRSCRVRHNIITDFSAVASGNAEETCQSNFKSVSGRFSAVECECGAEILFLPDITVMGNAIEVHVAMHMQKLNVPACTSVEAERLRDALIAQVFNKASQLENDGTWGYRWIG